MGDSGNPPIALGVIREKELAYCHCSLAACHLILTTPGERSHRAHYIDGFAKAQFPRPSSETFFSNA